MSCWRWAWVRAVVSLIRQRPLLPCGPVPTPSRHRDRWRPEAESFWDHVEAWESATDAGKADPVATVGAAPVIVAAASDWRAALVDAQLPGDITAEAATLAGAIDASAATWSVIGACGSDATCVEARMARVQEDLYNVRSAQFALRP